MSLGSDHGGWKEPGYKTNTGAHLAAALSGDGPGDAQAQADRVAAETLIRTTAQTLANGAPIKACSAPG